MVKLAEARQGFVLQPRRWVEERSFAWWPAAAFACLMLHQLIHPTLSPDHALGSGWRQMIVDIVQYSRKHAPECFIHVER